MFARVHARDGLYGAVATLGFDGRVVGRGGGRAGWARAGDWGLAGQIYPRGQHDRRRDIEPVLCDPCLYCSRVDFCLHRTAPDARAAARDFRAAHGGKTRQSEDLSQGIQGTHGKDRPSVLSGWRVA